MSKPAHNFETKLEIPDTIKPGPGWSDQMLEMSDHIGAKATLQLIERFGGEQLYVPRNPTGGKIADRICEAIGTKATETLCRVYGGEVLAVSVARYALERARRHDLIAAVRRGDINISAAARMLRMKRAYISHLVNRTDEGLEGEPVARRVGPRAPGQLDLFGAPETDA